jgi:hypothetical protein
MDLAVPKQDLDDLLSRVKEIEELLRFPSVEGHIGRATKLATSIARHAPRGPIAHIAMHVISEANALRRSPLPLAASSARLDDVLQRLRHALQDARDASED